MSKFKPKNYENLTIVDMAEKGIGVAKTETGEVIFVEKAVPGDIVNVYSPKKVKGTRRGVVSEFIKYSDDRVEPFCKHFGTCGGCTYQHLDYSAQLKVKEKMLSDALIRIAGIAPETIETILPAPATQYYRNKLDFAASELRWLTPEEINTTEKFEHNVIGFHKPGVFDKILPIDHCYLQADPSNQLRLSMFATATEQSITFYNNKTHQGLLRGLIIRSTTAGQIMVIVVFGEDNPKAIKSLLDAWIAVNDEITSVYYCINTKLNDYYGDLDMVLYQGAEVITELLGALSFRIGPKSFFQTNAIQAKRLYDVVLSYCGFHGNENVYDLYTGTGSIALYIAKYCMSITGIEEVVDAIRDANINAATNHVLNATFYAGDTKDVLSETFVSRHGKPDVVITDPPRSGMHPDVIKTLLQLEAPKIVYVSCNPSTQARDIKMLSDKYKVEKIKPVDMFPHTYHIESVALLLLK